jgi:transcription elongation GreA/GreB family factor
VQPGCIVATNNGTYYIAISAGQLKVADQTYFAISAASPIGAKMAGQKAGYEFMLNGKKYVIESVA